MIIERVSALKLSHVEPALWHAAQNRGATIVHREPVHAATVFSILHPELYEKLVSAEIGFAVFLPCRIAAFDYEGGSKLITMSPIQVARDLPHPDAATAAAALEHLLIEILDELAHMEASRYAGSGIGATEEEVDMRGTVAQRIDSHGSKIEDIAGTGEQDSPGG